MVEEGERGVDPYQKPRVFPFSSGGSSSHPNGVWVSKVPESPSQRAPASQTRAVRSTFFEGRIGSFQKKLRTILTGGNRGWNPKDSVWEDFREPSFGRNFGEKFPPKPTLMSPKS